MCLLPMTPTHEGRSIDLGEDAYLLQREGKMCLEHLYREGVQQHAFDPARCHQHKARCGAQWSGRGDKEYLSWRKVPQVVQRCCNTASQAFDDGRGMPGVS